ncbi:MAG TPA: hypothetical protein PKE66_00300 [Pyrinomonadaceae bacterium]|nr:hypothetical protein [Pyrinomonadaceae bacterium]
MARFDQIRTSTGAIEDTVNLTHAVGTGARNERADVLLIQTLFNYIVKGLGPRSAGLGGEYTVPEMSGKMDANTYSAIAAFQISNMRELMMKRFDGVIHPADYKNRTIDLRKRPLMTITYLHLIATDASAINGDRGYTQALARMSPELAMYLDASIFDA